MNTTNRKRFSTRTALLPVALVVCLASAVQAQQAVSWASPTNVVVRGSSLEKTRGCQGCDDAGAVSRQMIRSGDGYVEFTVGEDYTFWMAGLSRQAGTARFGNIDFAVRLNGNGWADVMENGAYVGGDTEYREGDVFRVEVVNNRVRYLKDGQVMHVSQKRPSYPLVLDVALGSIGSTIQNARIATRDRNVASLGSLDEFSELDRNDDGVVTRSEWRGTRRDFTLLDTNRDGVLTRREIGLDDEPIEAVGTAGEVVAVTATERWTDTGIYVRAGDAITFQAEGTVQMSGDPNDVANPSGSRRRAPDAPMRQTSAGSLIARIGNSAPFLVGASSRLARAPASGQLFLGVNDDYLGDNSGEFRVMVTLEPR